MASLAAGIEKHHKLKASLLVFLDSSWGKKKKKKKLSGIHRLSHLKEAYPGCRSRKIISVWCLRGSVIFSAAHQQNTWLWVRTEESQGAALRAQVSVLQPCQIHPGSHSPGPDFWIEQFRPDMWRRNNNSVLITWWNNPVAATSGDEGLVQTAAQNVNRWKGRGGWRVVVVVVVSKPSSTPSVLTKP